MNNLRQEIRMLIDGTECTRPATLRRSLRDDFLYATDLPKAASAEAVAGFLHMAEDAGWKTETEAGWILLDKIPGDLPEDMIRGPFGPEAQCCASLLRRHPDRTGNGNRERRMLMKAGEQGQDAYERVCGILHREWAAALRNGEFLPDIETNYFEE